MSEWDEETEQVDQLSFFTNPSSWPLFYQTAKNMKTKQIAGIAERKARHAVVPKLPIDFDARYEEQIPNKLVVKPDLIAKNTELLRGSLTQGERERYQRLAQDVANGKLTFLNRSIEFEDEIDWDHHLLDDYPLLWRLKLQSFEFLEWVILGFEEPTGIEAVTSKIQRWLDSWAANNPIGEQKYLRRSWIPHSVSLRILNWTRFAVWCERADYPVDGEFYRQLYKNALFLENHVEFEVGGNHLIENAIALIVAGVFFNKHDTGWAETGLNILENSCRTQFLADGGHFERSPMYHVMVLRRLATACHIFAELGYRVELIKGTTELALGFLEAITDPNTHIPLLNDSVRGEQITAQACIRYGRACGLSPHEVSLDDSAGSGYVKLISETSTLLIDVGEVGPRHLPAHSHNDQLSVLLWIDGAPVLADTGVYDYAATPRRQHSRAVAAHNTVQFEDVEPTPIGGSYLMGRRASVELLEQKGEYIRAQCERRSIVGPEYTHHREVSKCDGEWTISDHICSRTQGKVTVRYHFAPCVWIEEVRNGTYKIGGQGAYLANIQFEGAIDVELSESPYFERYGSQVMRPLISATASVGDQVKTTISIINEASVQ